jgi:hypothetical protein
MGLDGSMDTDGSGGTDSGPDGAVIPGNVFCDMTGQLHCTDQFTCIGATSCCGPTSGSTASCHPGTATCTAPTERQYCCPGTTTCPVAQGCLVGMGVGFEAGAKNIIPIWTALPVGATPAGVCQ